MEFLEVLTEGLERVLIVRGSGREVITMYSWREELAVLAIIISTTAIVYIGSISRLKTKLSSLLIHLSEFFILIITKATLNNNNSNSNKNCVKSKSQPLSCTVLN